MLLFFGAVLLALLAHQNSRSPWIRLDDHEIKGLIGLSTTTASDYFSCLEHCVWSPRKLNSFTWRISNASLFDLYSWI